MADKTWSGSNGAAWETAGNWTPNGKNVHDLNRQVEIYQAAHAANRERRGLPVLAARTEYMPHEGKDG